MFSENFTQRMQQPFQISEEAVNIRPINIRRVMPSRGVFEEAGAISVDEDVQKEDWKWPCFEEYNELGRGVVRKPKIENAQPSDIVPFNVVYNNTEGFCRTFVEFSSQLLIRILRDILIGNNDILNNAPRVKAQDLYHVMKELRDAVLLLESASEPTSESTPKSAAETEKASDLAIKKIHLKHLIRFLEHEYDQVSQNYERMLLNKVVSFDMLWVFYTKNLNVLYRCGMSGQHVGGIISSTRERFDHFDKQRIFCIKIKVIDYDGHGFKHCSLLREIGYFDGEMSFFDLRVVPFEFSNYLENSIADNGKRFFELAPGSTFMNYEGPLLRQRLVNNRWQLEKIRADGRVMIDILSFAAMNPGYPMCNATPPNKCDIEIFSRKGVYIDQIHQKDYYNFAPAVVYGFSFALKEWGQFEVLKFKEIDFDTGAFANLVMPRAKKDMLEGLVKHYEKPSGDEVNDIFAKPLDPVTNKGNGCIFLCYGPPGTGKTLTAECVAESLKRPLWMLSVHELGMKPDDLERQLVKILDVAFKWKAVLLLDEADIYLEKRDTSNLKRNAMVGIFLRHLEYYQGVLFLTTNRVITFDDAICSRINMFFYYPKLDLEGKHEIWTNFIRRANLPLNADDFVKYDLNGREIRNILHTAQLLVKSKGIDLTSDTVIEIIKTFQGFQEEMEEIKNNAKNSKEIEEE